MRNIKKSPERLAVARREAEELGGKIDKVYLKMGGCDLMKIVDFPDDATAATFALRLGAQGNARTKTMKAFLEEVFLEIVKAI
ncbi:MAG: GYD domain-containing protein [Alphaproteobacteria bacterium]